MMNRHDGRPDLQGSQYPLREQPEAGTTEKRPHLFLGSLGARPHTPPVRVSSRFSWYNLSAFQGLPSCLGILEPRSFSSLPVCVRMARPVATPTPVESFVKGKKEKV